jgi:hypothetical protein
MALWPFISNGKDFPGEIGMGNCFDFLLRSTMTFMEEVEAGVFQWRPSGCSAPKVTWKHYLRSRSDHAREDILRVDVNAKGAFM